MHQHAILDYFSSERAARKARRFGHVAITAQGSPLWVESCPEQGGRSRLCLLDKGEIREISHPDHRLKNRLHEYGGCEFAVDGDYYWYGTDEGAMYLTDGMSARRVYQQRQGERLGDFALCAARELVVAVRETENGVADELVLIRWGDGTPQPLWSGDDFISSPLFSPDGTQLLWKSWRAPDMPWDSCRVWSAKISGSALTDVRSVYDRRNNSAAQFMWTGSGGLYGVVEEQGLWQLQRIADKYIVSPRDKGEWGRPEWVPGLRTFGEVTDGVLFAAACQRGLWRFYELDIASEKSREIDLPFTEMQNIAVAGCGVVALIAGGPSYPLSLYLYGRKSGRYHQLWEREALEVTPPVSVPSLIDFSPPDSEPLNGWLYRPQDNPDRPAPLIVRVHGGPTACASSALDTRYQFWTARGYAILDLNYQGSSGFGRAFREALYGQAGELEVKNCDFAIRTLIENNVAIPNAVFLSGSSAGGFVALSAAWQSTLLRGAAVYYGITDVADLVAHSPRFERGYTERLFGPSKRWDLVSPLSHAHEFKCPLIFFHGYDDSIVPISQTERIVSALRSSGLPAEFVAFQGEGHGFRSAATIATSLERELAFFNSLR